MKRSQAVRNVLFLIPMVMVLQAGSCGDETDNPLAVGDEFRASVKLYGAGGASSGGLAQGECIHLFAPGEDFPCCQVCRPVDVGTVFRQTFLDVKRGDTYTFRAGRNGVELAVKSCTVSTRDITFLEVYWVGPLLECGAGFEVE